ncbi:trithorax group protein osa-like isoform X3 [Homarus americanus]|uniref:trithorax group protein osa-like isoform X3 n=1 Tax=Homarus americanus TaxID=6706 RepID=UPI001C46E0D8|nr:trithorax group protein osa-like isoform X3 [Homarus americanus]
MSVLELRLQIYTISLLEHSDISHQVTAFYLNVSFQMRLLAVYLPFSLVVVVVTISVSDSDERHTELTSRSGFISDKDLSQRTLRHVGSTFNDIQEGSPATTPSTTTTTQPQDTTHHPPSFSTPEIDRADNLSFFLDDTPDEDENFLTELENYSLEYKPSKDQVDREVWLGSPIDRQHHNRGRRPNFTLFQDPSQPGGPRRQSLRFQQQLHQHQQQHEEQELRRQLKEQLREQLEQQPREQFTPPTHPDISLIPLQAVEEDNGGNGVMGEKFPPYTEVFPPFPPHALPASTPSPVPQAPPKRHISQAIQAPSRPQVFQSQQGTQRPQIPQPQQVFQQPLNSHLFKVQQDTQSFQNPQISQAPPNHRLQVSQHPQSVQHPPSPQILQAPQRLQAPPKSQISQAPRDPQALRLLGEFRPPQALSDAPQEFQTAQAPQAVLAHHISPPLLSLQAPQTPQALQVSPGVQEAQVPDNTQVTPRPRLPVDFNEPNLPTGGPEVKFPTGAHGPRFPTGPHGPRFPTGPHTSRIPQGHRAPPRRPHPGGGPPQRVTGRRPPQRPLAPPVRDLTHPERPRPTPPRPGLRQARGRANLLPNRPSSSHTRVHSSPLSTGDVLTHRMDKGHMEVKSNVSTPNKNEIQVGAHDISFPSTYSIPDLNANIPERSDSLKVSLGNKNNIQKDPTRRLQQGGMKGRRPGVVEVLRKKLPQSLNLSETGHTVQKRLRKLVGSAATRASLMGKVTGEVLGAGVVAVGHAKDALIQAMSKPVGSPRAYETHTYASGLQLTVPHEDHVKHHRFGVRFNWSSTPPGGLLPVVGMGIDSNVMTKSLPSGSYVPPALLGPYTHSDSYHFNPLTYNNHPPNYHGSPPFHQGGPPHPPIHHGGPHLPPNYHGSPPFHQRGPPHPPIHHGGPPLPPNHQGSPFHQGGPPHPPIHHGGPPLPPNHQGSPFHQGGPPHHGGLLHPPIHQGGPPYPPIHEGNRRHPPVHHGGRLHSSFHQGRPANLPIINKDHLPNVNNGRLESTDHGDNSFTDNPYFTSHQEEDLEYLPDLGHDYPGKTGQFHRSSSNRPCWNGRWVRPPVTQVFQYGPHSYPPCAPRTHIPPHHRPRLSHNRNNPHHHQNNNKHNNQFQNNTHNTLNQDYPKQVKDIKDIIKYPSHPRDQRSKDDPKNESVFLNLRPDGIDIEAELNPYRSMDELRRAISQKEEEFTILDIISRENQELYFDQVIITGGDEEHKF